MSDRELLELAAKAAGYQLSTMMRSLSRPPMPVILAESGRWKQWDPLHDDGDALRLAAKLKLAVAYTLDEIPCEPSKCMVGKKPWNGGEPICWERFQGDQERYAATRRAIVRAAAEIGRQMG